MGEAKMTVSKRELVAANQNEIWAALPSGPSPFAISYGFRPDTLRQANKKCHDLDPSHRATWGLGDTIWGLQTRQGLHFTHLLLSDLSARSAGAVWRVNGSIQATCDTEHAPVEAQQHK